MGLRRWPLALRPSCAAKHGVAPDILGVRLPRTLQQAQACIPKGLSNPATRPVLHKPPNATLKRSAKSVVTLARLRLKESARPHRRLRLQRG